MLRWYRQNARDLPWRRTRDPWAIWVSEVMLQQTQVATALPFYLRFMRRFPTPASFARARESDVLAAWAGLGYYRRARNLHSAARVVAREHGGRVPREPEAFGGLPGVGRYTRAAVTSIAFGAPLAVLDGNVARVLARVFALDVSVRDPRGARQLWAVAESMVPARSPGDWNQALMELGATVCTPRAPRCEECPLRRACRARELRRPEDYPASSTRPATVRVRRAVALIERRGGVLMIQRRGALLEGLWEPPGVELGEGELAEKKLGSALRALGVRTKLEKSEALIRHRITHRAIEVEVWRGKVAALGASRARRDDARFIDPRDTRLPLTALTRKILR
ncbi:MAG TPA: A/G-specific adenine glycosylase [Candidatus Udaeobacter sp.]|nr:A/G-specific adenine glycosylase [Candidatus Udaeobacter sp.]